MKIKQARAALVKAYGQSGSALEPGQFSAIVSVFGNVDSYGDIMMPGAFADTLQAYKAAGDPIPVIWSHAWQDPMMHIGVVLEAREVAAGEFSATSPAGLWVLGQNDIDDNPQAAQASRLMAGGRVTQFSFAYEETNSGYGTYDGNEAWLIHGCDLIEVGPTLLGANQETTLVGAKRTIIDLATRVHSAQKAGARHSDSDMKALNDIHSALVGLGVPCEAAKSDVPSAKNDDSTDSQGSTDGNTDAKSDGVGASKLRTAGSMRSLDLLLLDVEEIS